MAQAMTDASTMILADDVEVHTLAVHSPQIRSPSHPARWPSPVDPSGGLRRFHLRGAPERAEPAGVVFIDRVDRVTVWSVDDG